ncbi:hypothetical protein L0P88_15475 [Muricauda sp. SCSIO 64092]|uniref:hypothetical protein n=1 Tax=Allomuricauda sp. SCSIO 64092 TaxID=2908842 RepID=UPI001FF4791F|nr:hypothetical protein [Muricauda sp. SCSIO 64092]UOY05346.1 hypothetical protein L0P88_15475 [Muricauda sp. SCSIO 64092]
MRECSKKIGLRVRRLRTEVYCKTQDEFVEIVNGYLNSKQLLDAEGKFTANTIVRLESRNSITSTKLCHLLNFLYETKGINPAWVMLERNEIHSPYLMKTFGSIDNMPISGTWKY